MKEVKTNMIGPLIEEGSLVMISTLVLVTTTALNSKLRKTRVIVCSPSTRRWTDFTERKSSRPPANKERERQTGVGRIVQGQPARRLCFRKSENRFVPSGNEKRVSYSLPASRN
jgi:hypothetical protein